MRFQNIVYSKKRSDGLTVTLTFETNTYSIFVSETYDKNKESTWKDRDIVHTNKLVGIYTQQDRDVSIDAAVTIANLPREAIDALPYLYLGKAEHDKKDSEGLQGNIGGRGEKSVQGQPEQKAG